MTESAPTAQCPVCGRPQAADAAFCSGCGAKLGSVVEAEQIAPQLEIVPAPLQATPIGMLSPDRQWQWNGAQWVPAVTPQPAFVMPPPKQRSAFTSGFLGCFGVGAAIIVVIVVLVVIGNKSSSTNNVITGGSGTATQSAHVGGTLTLGTTGNGSIAITLSQIIDPAAGADQFTTPDQGKRFVGVKLVIKNAGSQSESDDANNDVSIQGSDGQAYTASVYGISGCTNFTNGTFQLAPGEAVTGCVTFQVPTAVKLSKVQFTPSSGFGQQTGQWLVP